MVTADIPKGPAKGGAILNTSSLNKPILVLDTPTLVPYIVTAMLLIIILLLDIRTTALLNVITV